MQLRPPADFLRQPSVERCAPFSPMRRPLARLNLLTCMPAVRCAQTRPSLLYAPPRPACRSLLRVESARLRCAPHFAQLPATQLTLLVVCKTKTAPCQVMHGPRPALPLRPRVASALAPRTNRAVLGCSTADNRPQGCERQHAGAGGAGRRGEPLPYRKRSSPDPPRMPLPPNPPRSPQRTPLTMSCFRSRGGSS